MYAVRLRNDCGEDDDDDADDDEEDEDATLKKRFLKFSDAIRSWWKSTKHEDLDVQSR